MTLEEIRQRDIQALGAALSRRDWQEMEAAYNRLRDHVDERLQRDRREMAHVRCVHWTCEIEVMGFTEIENLHHAYRQGSDFIIKGRKCRILIAGVPNDQNGEVFCSFVLEEIEP